MSHHKGTKSIGKKSIQVLQTKVPKNICKGKYAVGKEVGKGAFGKVYKCMDTTTGKAYAVKTVSTKNMTPDNLRGIQVKNKRTYVHPTHP